MKHKLALFLLLLITVSATANVNDSILIDTTQVEYMNRIVELEGKVLVQQSSIKQLEQVVNTQKKEIVRLNAQINNYALLADSIHAEQDKINQSFTTNDSVLMGQIVVNDSTIKYNHATTMSRLMWSAGVGLLLCLFILCVTIILYKVSHKREEISFDKIREAHKLLQKESLKLDEKLVELLEKQLSTQSVSNLQSEPDHSFILKVADEIVRIETNLSRMDANVKGYKQLSASLRRIKDNFLSNGYEMVDMLGKPYKEGMKVIADFVYDETLNVGEQIISKIIKPQINYNGVMIQTAQITVSQNLD